ncbi:MAG: MFS transporter [Dethiobacter sp.]|nr:MAG: MFS transporter [Dethiobacter sp.]
MEYSRRWSILFLIYFSMLAFALVFQSIPPLLGLVISALQLSHTQAGALMGLFALPGIFISIPGGMLADIYGPRKIGILAFLLMVAGTILAGFAYGFPVLAAGRIISGIGAMTLAIVAPLAISRWFKKQELGTAMGLFNTAMPVGTIFAFNVFGRAGSYWGWQVPIIFTSVFSALVLVFFIIKYPGLQERKEREKKTVKEILAPLKNMNKLIWIVAAAWMTFNAAAISFLTFAPDYYRTAGYGVTYAGFLTSLFMLGSLLLSPLIGYLTDRIGKVEIFIAGGSIALAVLLMLITGTGLNPLLLAILIGLMAAFIPAPVFSIVPKLLPPEQVGAGYGVLSTCLNIGALIGPLWVGLSYDGTGSYVYGFMVMAIFALATAACAMLLKVLGKKEEQRFKKAHGASKL